MVSPQAESPPSLDRPTDENKPETMPDGVHNLKYNQCCDHALQRPCLSEKAPIEEEMRQFYEEHAEVV